MDFKKYPWPENRSEHDTSIAKAPIEMGNMCMTGDKEKFKALLNKFASDDLFTRLLLENPGRNQGGHGIRRNILTNNYWFDLINLIKSIISSPEHGFSKELQEMICSDYNQDAMVKTTPTFDYPQTSIRRLLMNKDIKMANIVKLLESHKNIILTGAPGTGKTYASAEIAMRIIAPGIDFCSRKLLMDEYRKKIGEGVIVFTTFHQSLDYEEFVEGIKPIFGDGEISYDIKKGIFRNICENASKTKSQRKYQEDFDAVFDQLTQQIQGNEDGFQEIVYGKRKYKVSVNRNGNLGLYTGGRDKCQGSLTKDNLLRQAMGGYNGSWTGYFEGVLEVMRALKLRKYEATSENKSENHVLIIDEINRGNVSKILGELITLLEPDKRQGAENYMEVTLPYSGEKFSVPENLYIIGTMNTADRSLGHIDYAVRRRFAFYTLKADRDVLKGNTVAIKLFDAVNGNDGIVSKNNINSDFDAEDMKIGHSYFMGAENLLPNRLEYEIKPLLREYIRDGILNKTDVVEAAIEKLGV